MYLTPGMHLLEFRDWVSASYESRVSRIRERRDPAVSIVGRGGRVCSSSVEFCELVQWIAVPEREEGGLVLVKQTFVGPLDVLMGRPVFVRCPMYLVCQDDNISLYLRVIKW